MQRISLGEAFAFNPKIKVGKGELIPYVGMDVIAPFTRDVRAAEERVFTSGQKFQDGDVLMARITPSLENGKTSVYRASENQRECVAFGSTEFIVIRGLEGLSDSEYAYYLMTSPDIRVNAIQSMTGSSGRQRVQIDQLKSIVINLPGLSEQRAIAATLGALDDKIESNRKAINLIQQAAVAIFSKWRSGTTQTTISTFGAYADVYGGATPKTTVPEYWAGDLAWATPTDVTNLSAPYLFETSRTITDKGLQSCTTVMHPAGTIFMTSRATIGAFAVNQIPAAVNQGFIAVRPRQEVDRYFLLEEMRSRVNEFVDNANGSTFLEISRGRFKELPLEVPGLGALENLDLQLSPLHRKAAQLALESSRLSALRNILLPELLSGRIRVPAEGVLA